LTKDRPQQIIAFTKILPMYRFVILSVLCFLTLAVLPAVRCADDLPQRQQQLGERYTQLEHVLQRLAEASAASYPKNAELLKKALDGSKNKLLAGRLQKIAEVLQNRRFTDAAAEQEIAEKDLRELLQILESADREQRRDNEKEQLKQLLRELENITQQERLLKNKTEQTEQMPKETADALQKEQEQIRLKTQTLKEQLQADLPQNNESGKPSSEDKHSDAATPPDGQPQESRPPEDSSPVGEAAKRMQKAEEKLQKPDKTGAVEEQEDAIAALQKAKAELEEKLRQLREEELIAALEKLEVRFKRMLQVEQGIRSQTEKICPKEAEPELSNAASSRQTKIDADRLALDQQTNVNDAAAALIMLREDGTARATAETLEQAQLDMTEIKQRLEKTQLNYMTLQIEDAVIVSLKELIDAVQAAKEEAKKRQNAQKEAESMTAPNEDEPLIQMLSDLRMIRTMQRRVNDRTAICEAEITKLRQLPNADLSVLQKHVEDLARQQNRISRILHDLKIGKAE
jgi:hypothetical protein